MTEYLDLRFILAMHNELIERYGGTHGIRDQGLLESALAQPQQSAFGEEIFPDVPSKASAYAYYISENQPFLDGNKRTATASAITFIRLNGYDFKVSEEELYDIMMQLANKKLSRKQLSAWFKKHCVKNRSL